MAVHIPKDVTTHLMNHLSLHPTLRTCSSDTILRAIKELTQENISYTSDMGKTYDFNTTDPNKDVQGLSCGFEVYVKYIHKTSFFTFETMIFYSLKGDLLLCKRSPFTKQKVMFYFRIYIVLIFKYLWNTKIINNVFIGLTQCKMFIITKNDNLYGLSLYLCIVCQA